MDARAHAQEFSQKQLQEIFSRHLAAEASRERRQPPSSAYSVAPGKVKFLSEPLARLKRGALGQLWVVSASTVPAAADVRPSQRLAGLPTRLK